MGPVRPSLRLPTRATLKNSAAQGVKRAQVVLYRVGIAPNPPYSPFSGSRPLKHGRKRDKQTRLKTCVPSRLGNSLTLQAAATCGASGGGQRWDSLSKGNGRLSEVGKRPGIRYSIATTRRRVWWGCDSPVASVTHRAVTDVTLRRVTGVTWPSHGKA